MSKIACSNLCHHRVVFLGDRMVKMTDDGLATCTTRTTGTGTAVPGNTYCIFHKPNTFASVVLYHLNTGSNDLSLPSQYSTLSLSLSFLSQFRKVQRKYHHHNNHNHPPPINYATSTRIKQLAFVRNDDCDKFVTKPRR